MKENDSQDNKLIFYRVIALWVVCETLLGGIIHSFNLPFSSIVLSGFSVICISLISKVSLQKGSILKATVIVIIFKFLLSPQSPPAAYLAVFMQGILGELLFSNFRTFKLNCILLGIFALAESALQRIIILLFLFGNDFPKAINKFVQSAFSKSVNTNYSLYLAGIYILIHIIFGGLIGYFAFSINSKSLKDQSFFIELSEAHTYLNLNNKKQKRKKIGLIIIWIIMIALLVYSWIHPVNKILSAKSILLMLIRSVIILLTWYLFLSPILLYYFKKWMIKKRQKITADIQQVIMFLPSTNYLIKQSWILSGSKKGVTRILLCCRIIVYNTLLPHQSK